jgi:sulfate transport system substrate-binding protein
MKSSLRLLSLSLAVLGLAGAPVARAGTEILNASYDVARELFVAINPAFVAHQKAAGDEEVSVKQSHAGSSRQARSILEGLKADVVTFNQVTDVQLLAENKFVAADWASRYPHNSSPYYSVHSILVRKGNPKGIKSWADLAKPGLGIVQVNPKTGGNGRYAVLAYYAAALDANGGDEAHARAFLKKVLANVVVFESGGRAATSTFSEREIGDVLVTFEAETLSLAKDARFEVVTPAVSILSEFPVAIVDKVAKKRGTVSAADAYLKFLYTPEAQEIIARNFYRPRNAEVAARHAANLAPVKALEVESTFGGWEKVTKTFFDNGALVDVLLKEVAAERVN